MDSRKVEEEYAALGEKNLWPVIYLRINQRCQSYPYTCIEAKKSVNKPLNRYRDVNPFDHSRIVLQKEEVFTDYINANLVQVPKANRQYILTQGPLVYTSGHFWLMVWEQNCPAIIMLNKIIEKAEIKCHWYWPHDSGDATQVSYPDVNMSIAQISEKDFGYYTIRQLRMTYHDTEESRDIWHFHYTTWPDFEVPQTPNQFLNFLTRVRDYGALDCEGGKGPSIVHCSAGIGRSGTFCLVDSVLVMIEKEGQADINIEEILLDMRRYRVGLIQTSEQLRFSYQAIVEGIKRLDPNYIPPSECEEDIYDAAPAEEDEAPPAPPPRGESLGRPPARPLPAIPASASMGNMDLSGAVESSDSEAPPTPPPREPLPSPPCETPSACSSYEEDEPADSADTSPADTTPADNASIDGLRRRRIEELATRVAAMKKRSLDADRWHILKRSLYKPLAISVGVLAISIFIYVYTKR